MFHRSSIKNKELQLKSMYFPNFNSLIQKNSEIIFTDNFLAYL